jgi:hypothetical protein
MKNSKKTTAVGIGVILGTIPCTLAGFLIWYLMSALAEGRAAGRDVGFDAIGIGMMMYFAYLLALGSCIAGLLYFSLAVRSRTVTLKAWHWFGILYSLAQVSVATIYMSAG